MSWDFTDVTELADQPASREQIGRLERRYGWARGYCVGRCVHELACGPAQGAALLAQVASRYSASDASERILGLARRHYGERIAFACVDAQRPCLRAGVVDVLILFEALYYLRDARAFFAEAARLLSPGGTLLLATANKDLYDFHPSPHSHAYLGAAELRQELSAAGFRVELFGDTPVDEVSPLQRVLRPVKNIASHLGLIPRSMRAKAWLKRIVFGALVPMPAELADSPALRVTPTPLPAGADQRHKVLFCAAHKPA